MDREEIPLYTSLLLFGSAYIVIANTVYFNILVILGIVSGVIYTVYTGYHRLKALVIGVGDGYIRRRFLYPLYRFYHVTVFKYIIVLGLYTLLLYGVLDPVIFMSDQLDILFIEAISLTLLYQLFASSILVAGRTRLFLVVPYLAIILPLVFTGDTMYPWFTLHPLIEGLYRIMYLLLSSLIILLITIFLWWYYWVGRS